MLYSFARREKNLTLLLNCACMDAETETGEFSDGRKIRIKSVTGYQLTTQQFLRVEARFFADCSGDSILAPLTGAECRIGRESRAEFGEDTETETADARTMGMSCLIQGRETTRPVTFTPPEWSTKVTAEDLAGRLGDPRSPVENYWYLELGGDRDSIGDTEKITEELIPLALGTWDYLKNSGHYDTKTWDLDFLGFLPGKRESRRMVGEYMVTQRDISDGKQYPDTVAYGGWPLDDHFPGGFYHKGRCADAGTLSAAIPGFVLQKRGKPLFRRAEHQRHPFCHEQHPGHDDLRPFRSGSGCGGSHSRYQRPDAPRRL